MDQAYLNRFIEAYHKWTKDRKTGRMFGREMAFYLQKKDERLKEKGLVIEEDYEHTEGEITGRLQKDVPPYHSHTLYREAVHVLKYHQDGRLIRKIREPVNIYVNVLDKDGDPLEKMDCPNCGHELSVSELEDHCPYCGTYFEIPQRYPCITSLYSVPAVVERSKLDSRARKAFLIPGGIAAAIGLVRGLFQPLDPWFLKILYGLFLGGFAGLGIGLGSYMLYSFSLLARLFFEGGRAMHMLGGINTRKKLESRLQAYDPDLSYEYFEGRMIDLLKIITFADDRSGLSVYTGQDDLSFLDDIVDLAYRGAFKLLDLKEIEGQIYVKVKAYMHDIHAGKKLERRDEDFIVCLKRDKKASGIGHDVCAVSCKGCGGSFDALHYRECPHCGLPYELVHDDWVVTSIRKA